MTYLVTAKHDAIFCTYEPRNATRIEAGRPTPSVDNPSVTATQQKDAEFSLDDSRDDI